MRNLMNAAAVAAVTLSTAAWADPVVDGTRDADYGAAKSHGTYSVAAPTSNFGTPTPLTDQTSYDIYLTSTASRVYGFIQAAGDGPSGFNVPVFSNLYFGLNGGGSNLGFEIGTSGVNAFIPANGSRVSLASNLFQVASVQTGTGLGLEFSLDNSLFTSAIAGLTYANGQVFPTTGSNVRLNLSQSLGYAVIGGATYGTDRLGVVTIGGATAAVPEPASWALMIVGFGAVGAGLRRRRQAVRVTYA